MQVSMTGSREEITGKIAAAFRLLNEDADFLERTNSGGEILFEVQEPEIRGLVRISDSSVRWNSASRDHTADLHVEWRSWEDLLRWTQGLAPVWWYRLLGRVKVSGRMDPVLQESIYLFRNILRQMIKD